MPNKSFSVFTRSKLKPFKKTIEVDSDKSISIRSFLISAISHNISEIKNVLESEDVFSTIKCLRQLGVKIKKIKSKNYLIYGKGLGSLYIKKNSILNCGNSGTLARLLIGILSTTPRIRVNIRGDKSLNKRNMTKLINLMSLFGASFEKNKSHFPINMISSSMPIGITYNSGVSAQLKSAAILAGLNSFSTTTIIEIKLSRDHTENMLKNSPGVLKLKKNIIKVPGKKYLNSLKLSVAGDPSSAAFFSAVTILNKKSYLKIKNVGLNPKRIGFYKILKKHGAKIKFKNIRKKNNELVGDILIQSCSIKPIRAASNYYASSADEYPIMFVIAALIPGVSIFKGIGDLANKESSRAHEMKKILNTIGVKCELKKDQMKIFGTKKLKKSNIIKVGNLGDHRICMAAMCLSLITGIKSNIKNFETVNTSSPAFLNIIKKSLGAKFEIKKN